MSKEFKIGERVHCEIPIPQKKDRRIIIEATINAIRSAFGRKIYTLTDGIVLTEINVSNIYEKKTKKA